jgi:hypothetical protein
MRYILLAGFIFSCLICLSQQKINSAPKSNVKPVQSPLVFTSSWGAIVSGTAPSVQIVATAAAPILVRDNTGKIYPVESFRFIYKFRNKYENDPEVKIKLLPDLRVGDFSNTSRLSKDWYESLKENLSPGDSIFFNRILFKNAEGKVQMAPDIKIAVR